MKKIPGKFLLSNVMKLMQILRKIVSFRKLPENNISPGIDWADKLQTSREHLLGVLEVNS